MQSDHSNTAGFLNFGTADVLGILISCFRDCPVHCRMPSSIPVFYPLDVSKHSYVPCAYRVMNAVMIAVFGCVLQEFQ